MQKEMEQTREHHRKHIEELRGKPEADYKRKAKKYKTQLKQTLILAKKEREAFQRKIAIQQKKTEVYETRQNRENLEGESFRQTLVLENRQLTKRLNEAERRREELEYMLKLRSTSDFGSSHGSINPLSTSHWQLEEQENRNVAELRSLSRHLSDLESYQHAQMKSFSG